MEQQDRDDLQKGMFDEAKDKADFKPWKTEPMMQFFSYAHLPEQLQQVSAPFHDLALHIMKTVTRNPERTAALRKLLEAKDCAVRAILYSE